MSFTIERFVALRPYLYHLTSQKNLESILTRRELFPARHLFEYSGETALNKALRRSHFPIKIKSHELLIRDQLPLRDGNIQWEPDWDMARFVGLLNDRVFFWPGDEERPIVAGVNHFKRYALEKPLWFRVQTKHFIEDNSDVPLEFSKFNSGAPRCVNGRKSPRGSRTFVPCQAADFTAGMVCEVTFKGGVHLPYELVYFDSNNETWKVDYPSDVIDLEDFEWA